MSVKSEREWEEELRDVFEQLSPAQLFEMREVIARWRLARHMRRRPHKLTPLFKRTWVWLPARASGAPRIIGAEPR